MNHLSVVQLLGQDRSENGSNSQHEVRAKIDEQVVRRPQEEHCRPDEDQPDHVGTQDDLQSRALGSSSTEAFALL